MKLVIRNREQLEKIAWVRLNEMLQQFPERGILLEIEEHKPPRTRRQQGKFHAMCRDMGEFIGEADMKTEIKKLSIWPRVNQWRTMMIDDKLERVKVPVPKSEAKLTKQEESEIIAWMESEAATWPGFEWSDGA